MEKIIRHPAILKRDKSALLIIDVQERILLVMRNYELMLSNIIKLVKGAKILNIPIFYTEQYPKGLGKTVDILQDELIGDPIQKLSFSCSGSRKFISSII